MALHTRLCERLGIEHPIIQSGMGRIAGPDLVAAVSNAGGLGILAGLFLPAEDLREGIRRVRALTDRPFGVNLWLHPALLPPPDPKAIAPHELQAVQTALNSFTPPDQALENSSHISWHGLPGRGQGSFMPRPASVWENQVPCKINLYSNVLR